MVADEVGVVGEDLAVELLVYLGGRLLGEEGAGFGLAAAAALSARGFVLGVGELEQFVKVAAYFHEVGGWVWFEFIAGVACYEDVFVEVVFVGELVAQFVPLLEVVQADLLANKTGKSVEDQPITNDIAVRIVNNRQFH